MFKEEIRAKDHAALVAQQFDPRAEAYVASVTHATGEDLEWLAGYAAERKPARALDLGCGGGHVSFHLAPAGGTVVAYDPSAEMLAAVAREAARRGLINIETEQGMGEALPFADASFDLVASRYSAHHWRDFAQVLREARRVVKRDGVAIFMDTVAPTEALWDTNLQAMELLRDPSHVRNYTEAQWRAALTEAGFKPGAATLRRLRLDFTSWVERMRTPALFIDAIRALQAGMPAEVRDYLEIAADGSFTIDKMTLIAEPV